MNGLRLVWGGVFLAFLNFCGTARHAEAQAAPTLRVSDSIADECWVFNHLNKAGGSTVKRMLKDIWGPQYFIYGAHQWHNGNDFSKLVADDLVDGENRRVVAGGYVEALRRTSAGVSRCKWFTVFRHPISRMVSAYYFCKISRSCASDITDAKQVDLITFAKHWGNYAMRQFALSFVSIDDVLEYSHTDAMKDILPSTVRRQSAIPGWYLVKLYLENQPQASVNEDIPDAVLYSMLQPVQDLLRDQYSVVGILEEFNTTLSLFNAALDMPGVDWHEQYMNAGQVNVNNDYKDEKIAALEGAWANSDIKRYIQLDLLVYEHAVDLFHQQARAYNI